MATIKSKGKRRNLGPKQPIEMKTIYFREGPQEVPAKKWAQFKSQEQLALNKRAELIRRMKKHEGAGVEFMDNKLDVVRFIPRARVKTSGFKNAEDFINYVDNRGNQIKPEFFESRAKLYMSNMETAMMKTFGQEAIPVINELRKLTPDQFQWMLLRNPTDFSISYIYLDPMGNEEKMKHITQLIGRAKEFDEIIGY